MIYHEFYNQQLTWIATATHEGVASLPTGVPLYSGLYIPNLTPEQLGEAVHLTRDAGAAGVSLFQMDIVTDDHLSHLT